MASRDLANPFLKRPDYSRFIGQHTEPEREFSGTLAIVVPTRNRPGQLEDNIAELARDYRIIVLGTIASDRDESRPVWRRDNVEYYTGSYENYAVLDYATPHADLAAKRNFGVDLARSRGIEGIVFLDDDVAVGNDIVGIMAGRLSRYEIVGTSNTGQKDHSYLYSVLASTEAVPQFISANCLAVRSAYRGIFPTIYNEDWFYFFPALLRGSVGIAGQATQLPRSLGAVDEARVEAEELGDLLAEGLFHSLHDARTSRVSAPVPSGRLLDMVLTRFHSELYWQSRIHDRALLFRYAREFLQQDRTGGSGREMELLRHGEKVLQSLSPDRVSSAAAALSSACDYGAIAASV